MCIVVFFRLVILVEAHGGMLSGNFGRDKTLALLQSNFYWLKMQRDVDRFIKQCRVCHLAKTMSQNSRLYTPLVVPMSPWEDVSLDFVVGLPKTQRNKDSIMMVVDHFFKMFYFVPCNKTNDAFFVANLYFIKIVKLHDIPKSMA